MGRKKGKQKIAEFEMIEILWHGRGGQGAFSAAKLLGAAYSAKDGNYSLAFPSFGPERRGAPILAFTKLDGKKIGDRSQIKKADFAVYLDDTLFTSESVNELKKGGKILINTKKTAEDFSSGVFSGDGDFEIVPFDGNSIAQEILKMPVSNTVMLALLGKVSGIVSENELIESVKEYMGEKIAAKNALLISEVFKRLGENK